MRARPWVAHARFGLARMLVARGEPARAVAVAVEALDTYRELGMPTWAERCAAVAGG